MRSRSRSRIRLLAAVLFMSLFSVAAQAQIALSTLIGTTETPVTSSYTFAPIGPYGTEDATFVATNTGGIPVTVCNYGVFGIGFKLDNSPTPPVVLAAGRSVDFFVEFTGGPLGNYSANLAVNYVTNPAVCSSPQTSTPPVALQGTVTQAATVSVAAPCTGPDSQGIISFGRIAQTSQVACTFTLANPYTQELSVSPIALTGAAFQAPLPSQPAIPAGQSITFAVTFTAATATTFNGTLIAGVQTFYLTGTGYLTPLPAPVLSFDTTTLRSGEQHTLTAALPFPASTAATGTITMTFTPWTNAIADDATVRFVATSKRVIGFSVAQGATALLLNTNNKSLDPTSTIFSTGTSAGTITFTVDAGAIGISGSAKTTAIIGPAPVAVTAASATSRTADLDVGVTGFDNTYTAGAMTFTFYDRSGNTLGAPIQADFTAPFHLFYQGDTGGSTFLMLVSFPVLGHVASVGSVDVQLTNAAGSATVQRLKFP
ncbi:MAG TPA: hypothetical protein VGR73_22325 [Bryobacteraceae bacterium]|nr:hypothetical protein [Bryobacteraceae bacterium]